jgi:hypothetical protein
MLLLKTIFQGPYQHWDLCPKYKWTKLHFKLQAAARRHVLCVRVGRDRTHAASSRGARYTLDQLGHPGHKHEFFSSPLLSHSSILLGQDVLFSHTKCQIYVPIQNVFHLLHRRHVLQVTLQETPHHPCAEPRQEQNTRCVLLPYRH